MKPTTRIERIANASEEIFGDDPEDLKFIHAILAHVSLPYRAAADATDYSRTNGRASVHIQAGVLFNPETGEMEKQGLPFGAKPRVLLYHLCSEAMRTRKSEIAVDSMSSLMKHLGLRVTGGKTGTIAGFKDQLNRLAASKITFGFRTEHDGAVRGTTINTVPVERFDAWFPKNADQRVLWRSSITLSRPFFESLKEHAFPVDPRAVAALQDSARALDAYVWLAHRLPRVRRRGGDFVSWKALHQQFGGEIKRIPKFRELFVQALREATAGEIYGDAKIEIEDKGLRLFQSPSPIDAKNTHIRGRSHP